MLVNHAQFKGVGDHRHTPLTLECDFVLARQVLYSSNRTVCVLHTFFSDGVLLCTPDCLRTHTLTQAGL